MQHSFDREPPIKRLVLSEECQLRVRPASAGYVAQHSNAPVNGGPSFVGSDAVVGAAIPAARAIRVDFPAPLGPTSAATEPVGSEKESPANPTASIALAQIDC
jgi:hypothetical protein